MKLKMKMRSRMLFVPMMMPLMSLLIFTKSGLTSAVRGSPEKVLWPNTPAVSPGSNLKGKMFTLSYGSSGITFFPPYHYPTPSDLPSTSYFPGTNSIPTTYRPYTNTDGPYPPTTYRPYTDTDRPYTPTTSWTTSAPTRGLSLCLRYFTDYMSTTSFTVFTVSPSSTAPLRLNDNNSGMYSLSFNGNSLSLKSNKHFWSSISPDIWTRLCFTIDTKKNVAQVFRDSTISIRKMFRTPFVWSGVPVLDFSGFDGQLTDVQMWDYPLSYGEIYNYMAGYESCRGSVLTWSYIGYSVKGNTLLEDTFYIWGERPVIGRRPHAEKKRELLSRVGRRNRKTEEF